MGGINCSNCNCAWSEDLTTELNELLSGSQNNKTRRQNSISIKNSIPKKGYNNCE
jgi:hypothetical protein